MAIYKVGVIGGGAMGQGIASLVAQQGVPVVIKEMNEELAAKARRQIDNKIDQAVERGKLLLEKADMAKALISVTAGVEELKDADLIIEAVFEEMEVKQQVFQELDQLLPPQAIFASNTSSLPISVMASVTNRRARVAGVHFFNPPITRPLVELIAGQETSKETIDSLEDFAKNALGKVTIRVKECPGFLVNRMLLPYLNEAALLLGETNLSVEAIDDEARKFGWPMGPFALLDYLGVDVSCKVAKILYAGYGERARPAPVMKLLVELSRYGKKSGAGFYVSDGSEGFEDISAILKREFPNRKDAAAQDGFFRMMAGMANEAFLCLEEGIATAADIEKGCLYGVAFPFALGGPLHWAEKFGLDKLLAGLRNLEQACGLRFKPSALLAQYAEQGKKIFENEESW